VSWIHGLGYQPHVALYEDPILLRRKMDSYGVRSRRWTPPIRSPGRRPDPRRALRAQVDPWANLDRLPLRGHHRRHAPARGLTDDEAMDLMKRSYEQIVEVAEAYKMMVNIEPHGYFTTKPDMMAEMLAFCDSEYLRMNMDTGNTFIAGQDPAAFLKRFLKTASAMCTSRTCQRVARRRRARPADRHRVSQCAIGDGVNADNIKKCLSLLHKQGFDGVLSIECEGQAGPMIEKSLAWLRKTLQELGIPEEA
jgi:inosose dehydratase